MNISSLLSLGDAFVLVQRQFFSVLLPIFIFFVLERFPFHTPGTITCFQKVFHASICPWPQVHSLSGTISPFHTAAHSPFCPYAQVHSLSGTIFSLFQASHSPTLSLSSSTFPARDNLLLLPALTPSTLSLSSSMLFIKDNHKSSNLPKVTFCRLLYILRKSTCLLYSLEFSIYSFITSMITGEHHVFLGLRSLQFPFVHAPVIFLISFNVLAPLFIASTICPFVTWLQ